MSVSLGLFIYLIETRRHSTAKNGIITCKVESLLLSVPVAVLLSAVQR